MGDTMSDDVVELNVARGEPQHEVIDLLEDLLERALAGDVQTIALTTVNTGGTITTSWTTAENVFELAGAVALLSRRVVGIMERTP